MWSQLGRQRQGSDDNGESQQTTAPAGGLWSRLVQVAADVAQDLAQPNVEDDDDGYYDEGEGWDESVGLDETPSWEEQGESGEGQHYERTEEPYADGEEEQYEEGGEGGDYEQGDEQHYEQVVELDPYEEQQQLQYNEYADDDEGAEGQGWDEEEVGFSMENEQNDSPTPNVPEERSFLEEQQTGEEELPANNGEDNWDLEDEYLGDDEPESAVPLEHLNRDGEQQLAISEELVAQALESHGENAWGHDDSLNFDVTEETPRNDDAPDPADNRLENESPENEWYQDNLAVDESGEENPNLEQGETSVPDEASPEPGQVSQESYDTANEEGGAWDEEDVLDLDGFDDHPRNSVEAELPAQGLGDAAGRDAEGGVALLKGELEGAGDASSIGNVDEVGSCHKRHSVSVEQVESDERNKKEWDVGASNFTSQNEGGESDTFKESAKNILESEKSANTVVSLPEPDSNDHEEPLRSNDGISRCRDDNVADNDLDTDGVAHHFTDHQETTAAPQLQPSEETHDPANEEWSDDDLNFSENQDEFDDDGRNDEQDPTTQVGADDGPSPATSESKTELTADREGSLGDNDMKFSQNNSDVGANESGVNKPAKAIEAPDQHKTPHDEEERTPDHVDGWGEDDLSFSEQNSQLDKRCENSPSQGVDGSTLNEGSEQGQLENAELGAFHSSTDKKTEWNEEGGDSVPSAELVVQEGAIGLNSEVNIREGAWNESGLNLDVDEWGQEEEWIENQEKPRTDAVQAFGHSDDGDDDSTVEQSNIGFEQSTEEHRDGKQTVGDDASAAELKFALPGRTPSRRATIRASNTSSACVSRKGSEDDDSEMLSQNFVGTSVMFAELTLQEKNTDEIEGVPGRESSTGPNEISDAPNITGQMLVAGPEREAVSDVSGFQDTTVASEVSGFRDTLSSVSVTSVDLPKPVFETQISMMTLKSIADSCPSRPREDDDSDEDDEVGYLPVVDKTPEGGDEANTIPELSTMTINSNAVAIHTGSVNEDIQRDDDMDGTYYGGSTAGEGQSNENAWEDDEAISLGGLHDLAEKIVNFELSAGPIDTSTIQPEASATPLDGAADVETSAPPMDSSMAMLFTDDNSVPSRDNDDDSEDNFKPVIDQIPKPLQDLLSEKSGRTLNSLTAFAGVQDDGKHDVSAAKMEVGRGEDSCWDDGFLGDIELNETAEGEKLENNDENEVVVDNTPAEANSTDWKSEGSLAAVESADNSCPSRVHDSDDEMYGRVVDQIPASPPPLLDQMSVTASSMAVVANNVAEDLKRDDELDASDHGGSTVDDLGGSGWDDDELVVGDETKNEEESQKPKPSVDTEGDEDVFDGDIFPGNDRVVDLTPKMEGKKVSRLSSNSLAVLAHSVNIDFEDEDESEDDTNFGPIVDITPNPKKQFITMTPSSTAVQAAALRDDSKQDETTEDGVGDVNWDDECPELEGMESGEEDAEETTSAIHTGNGDLANDIMNQNVAQNQVAVVDHTPEGETHRKLKGDASLAVLAPSEEGTVASMINDDELTTTDPNGGLMSYGPVVDITPTLRMQPIAAPSTAPSVTFSLAVEAHSVDQDIKLDDEMDETFCGDTTLGETGGEGAWADDQTLDDLTTDASITRSATAQTYKFITKKPHGINQGEQMVDHTPQMEAPRLGDASLVALAPSEVGTYRSATDSAIDDDTITHEEDLFGKMVDHTPRLTPLPLVSSNSMAVGASSTDFRSDMDREEDMEATLGGDTIDAVDENEGWGDDEEALDGIDAPVQQPLDNRADEIEIVDHTPVSDGQRKPVNTDPSVRVLAPSDESSREEDNDTFDGNHAYGPVVDFTPQTSDSVVMLSESVVARHDGEFEGTLYGDSTVGGDAGWDDDALDEFDEEKGIDCVEANPPAKNLWQPAETISGTVSSQMEGSNVGKLFPGPSRNDDVHLVDHTPSEIDSSAQKNSVAWLINVESGISGDETDDAGARWRDSEQVAIPAAPPEADQVVDRIPLGSQSRYGDASTLVVADPSEVLSHVGDLLQEDDFGPVVDLTPPARSTSLTVISAAASTAVVAPTVGPDDLDDADADDTVVAAEDNGWEGDPSEVEAPNPQSGNEEPARVREQVVDFLPPQQEQAPDQNRDGWSEVATGAAPSVLAADPKEDEFGPVVDQLPATHPSPSFAALSTASQVASSECDALAEQDDEDGPKKGRTPGIVVGALPNELALQNVDSTASYAQSLASEDEEDDSKYGPVIDHVPSIRSSMPTSRGGSTVDALATVSEVIDDDDDDDDEDDDGSSSEGDNNGWGDDDLGEIDLSERDEARANPPAVSEEKERSVDNNNPGDRGMTVRFQSVVAAIFESKDVPLSRPSFSGPAAAGGQIFHDDDADIGTAWDDEIDFDVSLHMGSDAINANDRTMGMSPERFAQFAEADTPPATPYSRTKPTHRETSSEKKVGVALPDLSAPLTRLSSRCLTCADAATIDCPCVQRILRRKEDGDDEAIKIDYTKLLQTEIAKRLLIEEESKDLRLQLDTLKRSKSATEVRVDSVRALQEHVKVIERKLKEAVHSSDELRDQNQKLQSSLADAQSTLSSLEEQRDQWAEKAAALRHETEETKRELNRSLSEAKKNQEIAERELKAGKESKEQVVEDFNHQMISMQAESSRLRAENSFLAADLQAFRERLEEKERQIANFLTNESQFEAELTELKVVIKELEMACASARELEVLYKEVESELVVKDSLCEQLRNDVVLLEKRAEKAEGDQCKLVVEGARLRKLHENEMTDKQKQLETLQAELADLRIKKNLEVGGARMLQNLQDQIQKLSKENESFATKAREAESAEGAALDKVRTELNMKIKELHDANQQLAFLHEQNHQLEAGLRELASLSAKAEALEDSLKATCVERDAVKRDLQESNDMVARMKQRLEAYGLEKSANEESLTREIDILVTERSGLRNDIDAKCRNIEALESQAISLLQEKANLEHEVSQLKSSCEHFQGLAESTKVEAADATEYLSKVLNELESLQQEFLDLEKEKEAAEVERLSWWNRSRELETSLNSALQDVTANAASLKELNQLLAEKQRDLHMLYGQQQSVITERDQLRAKCEDLEARISGKAHESRELTQLMQDNSVLSEQVRSVQQELDNQSLVLQSFEARAALLEHELSSEKNANAAKDETIALLESTRRRLEISVEGASKLPERIAELESMLGRLEAERNDYDQRAELLAMREQESKEQYFSVVQERNQALNDREGLAQENEEMLVQFGLLNEQMDSYREQIHELQQLVQSYEQTTAISDARLLELQQRLLTAEHALENGRAESVSPPEEKIQELFDLRNEQMKLIEEIEQLNSLGLEKDDIIGSLTQELATTKSQLSVIEAIKAQSEKNSKERDELRFTTESLELQRNELSRTIESQQETITGLMYELAAVKAAASSYESRAMELEETCAKREDDLQQKKYEIRQLLERVHDSSRTTVENAEEILNLRNRVSQMERLNEETTDRLHELTAENETAQEQLASTKSQIATLEALVEHLEQEMSQADEKKREQSALQEEQISMLTNTMMDRKKELAEMTKRNASLVKEVEALRSQLDAAREQALATAVDSGDESAEVGILKDRVLSLEEQLETLRSSSTARDESLQEEISGLKRRIATKDGEALMLKNKVEALRGEVQGSRNQVESKASELQQLAAEIDNLRKEQESLPETSHITALELLQRGKGNAENVENLRATVISLAGALETSENLRADAIDRLLKERETYASSLRHFSDSVKRFYNTLHLYEK